MKPRYFLNHCTNFKQLRKLNNGKLYWFTHEQWWMLFDHIETPEEHILRYTEITEEEAFRYILEN